MKTLKQRFYEEAKKIHGHFLTPETALTQVKEWLQQKRKHFMKGDLILTDLGVIDELLEELEQ